MNLNQQAVLKSTIQDALRQKIDPNQKSQVVTARGKTALGNDVCKLCKANKQAGIITPPVHPHCRCHVRKIFMKGDQRTYQNALGQKYKQ